MYPSRDWETYRCPVKWNWAPNTDWNFYPVSFVFQCIYPVFNFMYWRTRNLYPAIHGWGQNWSSSEWSHDKRYFALKNEAFLFELLLLAVEFFHLCFLSFCDQVVSEESCPGWRFLSYEPGDRWDTRPQVSNHLRTFRSCGWCARLSAANWINVLRVIMIHKFNILLPVPVSYFSRIEDSQTNSALTKQLQVVWVQKNGKRELYYRSALSAQRTIVFSVKNGSIKVYVSM